MKLSFKLFLENEEKYESIYADIPMPPEVYSLSDLFTKNGASLFAVGGAIRDYLYHIYHDPKSKYDPKDVDLATEATPDKITNILNSPEGQKLGIKVVPKGEAFGVISAILNGQEYEIATFREDGTYSDGRRPDSVNFSTPGKDSARRDLTFNALFYDIHKKEIRDYNNGQGIQDIKDLIARPVGNAQDRFKEDKLRIPRLIRFFSRFNPGSIKQHLDQNTLNAIEAFKDLAGVSPERIANEFKAGLEKCKNPVNYILNYYVTDLFPAVFPGLKVDIDDVQKIGNIKRITPVLAWLLKSNDDIRRKLNNLKWPNDISDTANFLIQLMNFDPNKIFNYIKYRDAHPGMDQDILDFGKITGMESEFIKFLNYKQKTKSQDFLHLKGPEISKAMANAEKDHYLNHKLT